MKTTLLLFAGLITSLAHAQTFEYLDINQVKARVNSGGDLHWDPNSGNFGGYECPKGSGKYWGGPASLWVGGVDVGGQLKLAAQTYHQGGVDFWPGPLDIATASTNSATVNQYNRVWKLNKTDIDDFITNFANGNVQNGSFIPAADLLSWPGNGDISQNYDSQLAPYMDVNSDAVYDPMAGDYPLIKGDQAIYTIFNDNYLPHGSAGQAIGLEIRLMAYAFGTGTLVANNSFLNYTTFYNYSIINRSSFSLYNVKVGLFNDNDIGYMDDYVGCDVIDSYAYTYNAPTSTITNEPAIGITQTKGPINTTNMIDDNNNGQIDESGEQMGMTNFMYFNNSFPSFPIQTTDPSNATEYFNYMNSIWKDGTHLSCGGIGYGGTGAGTALFAYPGNSNLSTLYCGGTPWFESGAGSDRRFIMSSGPSTLFPGSFTEVEYAYIASFDSITNNPIQNLDSIVHALKLMNNSSVTSITKQDVNNVFTLSPNPTNALLNINSGKEVNGNVKIEVIDALGKILVSEEYKDFNQSTINVSSLSSGIYFVKISSGDNTTTKKFIKE